MKNNKEFKAQLYTQLQAMLESKVAATKEAIEAAKESRDNETKSTAGDKYETGRAMMQIEMEKNEVQLRNALNLQNELSQINIQKECIKVEQGSLVSTNYGNYFISIGLGKIEGTENAYAISLASPIGMLLKDKTVGDKILFQGREFAIGDIV